MFPSGEGLGFRGGSGIYAPRTDNEHASSSQDALPTTDSSANEVGFDNIFEDTILSPTTAVEHHMLLQQQQQQQQQQRQHQETNVTGHRSVVGGSPTKNTSSPNLALRAPNEISNINFNLTSAHQDLGLFSGNDFYSASINPLQIATADGGTTNAAEQQQQQQTQQQHQQANYGIAAARTMEMVKSQNSAGMSTAETCLVSALAPSALAGSPATDNSQRGTDSLGLINPYPAVEADKNESGIDYESILEKQKQNLMLQHMIQSQPPVMLYGRTAGHDGATQPATVIPEIPSTDMSGLDFQPYVHLQQQQQLQLEQQLHQHQHQQQQQPFQLLQPQQQQQQMQLLQQQTQQILLQQQHPVPVQQQQQPVQLLQHQELQQRQIQQQLQQLQMQQQMQLQQNTHSAIVRQQQQVLSANGGLSLGTSPPASSVTSGLSAYSGHDLSSEVLGQDTKQSRFKKDRLKPKRPLSAYNLFFKDERAKLLAQKNDRAGAQSQHWHDPNNEDGTTRSVSDKSSPSEGGHEEESMSSSNKTSSNNGSQRKRKRESHGKLGFEMMAKIIGARWKSIDNESLAYYKEKAGEDMQRYRTEMGAFLEQQRRGAEENREQLESCVDEATKRQYFSACGRSSGVGGG